MNELNTSVYKRNVPDSEKDSGREPFDKICPMCGKTFQKDVPFTEFQTHVEKHFMGDSVVDLALDNFENINSFGNVI